MGEYRIGLSAGRVASGLLRGTELSFGIWGPPVKRALNLAAAASAYQILVDETMVDDLSGEWDLRPVDGKGRDVEDLETFSLHPKEQS